MYLLLILFAVGVTGADLEGYHGVQWLDHPANDADSFLVELPDGDKVRVRLYFVDAPEKSASWDADVRRVREQRRYFGLPDAHTVLEYGQEASDFTRKVLSEPFTVHTAFASALGRSESGRVYAFVQTADGRDLGALLVRNGLAREYGVGRETPEGTHRDEMKQRLADMEASAMLKNLGIWEQTDADQLDALRAEQRREESELWSIRRNLRAEDLTEDMPCVNINSCSSRELQQISGIGPATARRIIEQRPYADLDDLLAVSGISRNRLDQWRPFLCIHSNAEE